MWSIEALKFLVVVMCVSTMVLCTILIGFAADFLKSTDTYSRLLDTAVQDLPISAIAVALLIIFLCAICIIGTILENRFVLYVTTALLSTVLGVSLVLLFVYLAVFSLGRNMFARRHNLMTQCPPIALILAQQDLECCGYRGPQDYIPRGIHKSCCKGKPTPCVSDSPFLFHEGCTAVLGAMLSKAGSVGAGLCCSILLFQISTVVHVYVLCDELKKEDLEIEAELEEELRAANISARKSEIRQELREGAESVAGAGSQVEGERGRRSRLSFSSEAKPRERQRQAHDARSTSEALGPSAPHSRSSGHQPDTSSPSFKSGLSSHKQKGKSRISQREVASMLSKQDSEAGPSKDEGPYNDEIEVQQRVSRHRSRSSRHERESQMELFPLEPRPSTRKPRVTIERSSQGRLESRPSGAPGVEGKTSQWGSEGALAPKQSDASKPLTTRRQSATSRPESPRPSGMLRTSSTPRVSEVQRTSSTPRISEVQRTSSIPRISEEQRTSSTPRLPESTNLGSIEAGRESEGQRDSAKESRKSSTHSEASSEE